MAVYGGDTFGDNTVANSMIAGGGNRKSNAMSLADASPNPLAGNIEALSPQAKREMELDVKGEGRMMDEYSELIEAYFRRMAEDDE